MSTKSPLLQAVEIAHSDKRFKDRSDEIIYASTLTDDKKTQVLIFGPTQDYHDNKEALKFKIKIGEEEADILCVFEVATFSPLRIVEVPKIKLPVGISKVILELAQERLHLIKERVAFARLLSEAISKPLEDNSIAN